MNFFGIFCYLSGDILHIVGLLSTILWYKSSIISPAAWFPSPISTYAMVRQPNIVVGTMSGLRKLVIMLPWAINSGLYEREVLTQSDNKNLPVVAI